MGYVVSGDDVFVQEVDDLLGNAPEWCGLYPLGYVIDCYHGEFHLSFSHREGSHQVDPPHREWDRGEDAVKFCGGLFRDRRVYLALVEFLYKVQCILYFCGPVVAVPEYFVCQGLVAQVVTAYPFVHLF